MLTRGSPRDDPEARAQSVLLEYAAALAPLAAHYAAPDDREDLLQDILFALWRALPAFRGESSIRTFVYRIAHYRGIAYWRSRRHDTIPLADAPEPTDPGADSAADLEHRLERERLAAAVEQLPPAHRETVKLCLLGWSNGEIAAAHGVTENNVGVRLHRARRMLQRSLCASD